MTAIQLKIKTMIQQKLDEERRLSQKLQAEKEE